jgi:glycosyltransferase involved in cell wall biosynthesis
MTSARPRVSVLIPSWNGEDFVGAAIDSVLGQTFSDFELVVVDDHSTDATMEIARRRTDSRLRIVAGEANIGLEANWNRALAEARGGFVKILPQDDLLAPDCLEKQVAVLDDPAHSSVVLVSCARNVVDTSGKVLLRRSFRRRSGRLSGRRAVRECVRAGTNLIGEPGAVLLRSAAIQAAGRFDGTDLYLIDLDFWCRALVHGDIFILPEVLASFRVSRVSTSARIAASQSRDFRRFAARMSRDGRFGLTRLDLALGGCRASIKAFLRRGLYFWLMKGKKA